MNFHRLPDWEERLSSLITRVHDRQFEYGKFDCGQFARMAIAEMIGVDLGRDNLSGYCDDVSAGLLLRRAGADDMGALAEIIAGLHGIREIQPGLSKRGDIVLAKGPDGPGLAVVVGEHALAPSRDCTGVGRVPRENWLRAWSTEKISPSTNLGELFPKVDGPFIAALVPILLSTVISFAFSAIVGVISQAFTKKPKKNPLSFEDRTITIRQSIEPWHGVIGSPPRVGGDIFFFERLGADVWLGIEWAHHPCKAIDSIYADDEQIFVNVDASVESARNGQLEVYHHLGADPETADVALKTAFPLLWTDAHRGDGITYSIFRFVDLATNWENTIPNMSADIRGALWIDPRTGTNSYTDNLAVVARGLLIDMNFGEGAPGEEIDNDNFIAQANICDEEIAIAEWRENWKISQTSTFTVDTGTDVITLGGTLSSFATPTKVYVWSQTTLAAPLVHQTAYYYRKTGSTTGTLHPTESDAINNTNKINLTTAGTGTQRIVRALAAGLTLGKETTFTAAAATDILTLAERIYAAGTTTIVIVSSTGTLPAPLVAGTKYFATGPDSINEMQLYSYPGGSLIDITTAGTGTHTIRIVAEAGQATPTGSDATANTIRLNPSAGLQPRTIGRPMRVLSSGTPPTPLQNGQTVYLIPVDSDNIKVAESRSAAESSLEINLTSTGSTNWYLETIEVNQDEIQNATTGMVVQVNEAPGDTLPAPFATNTDYYLIRLGRARFRLAASLQDALDGVNIEPKPTNGYGNLVPNRFGIMLKRERRYTANGVIDTDQDTLDIEKAIGACCAGALLEPLGSGKWRLKVGTYPIPLGTLQLKHMRQGGQPELQCLMEGNEAATTVKGVYSSPFNFDHPSDIPAVSDPAFIAEDGGEDRILDAQYPFTNSKFMARRVAQIALRRKRLQRTLRLPVTLPAGFKYEFGDGVRIDLDPLPIAFDAEIAGWNFQTRPEGDEVPKPSIDLILRETDPWVYR